MKICMIASLYAPYARGGAEVFVSNLVDELKKSHDVFVITAGEWHGLRSLVPSVKLQNGVRVYRFYPLNFFSFIHINEKQFLVRALWSFFDMLNPHSIVTVRSILRCEQPDVVMVHALKGLSYGIASLLNMMKARWMYTPHDIQLVIPSGRLQAGDDRVLISTPVRLYSVLTRLLFGSPPLIVSSSRFLSAFYRERGFFPKSVVQVLPSPAPTLPSLIAPQRCSRRFVFLGQLERSKAIDLLVHAFRSTRRSDLSLDIFGNGSLVAWVKEQCAEDSRIRYLGYVSSNEKYSYLAPYGYMIVSSRVYENSPNVIYEAFSLGIPVICTDIGGAAELVKDGVNGYVIPPENAAALTDTIEKAADASDYNSLSQAALKTVAGLTLSAYCNSLLSGEYSERR